MQRSAVQRGKEGKERVRPAVLIDTPVSASTHFCTSQHIPTFPTHRQFLRMGPVCVCAVLKNICALCKHAGKQ